MLNYEKDKDIFLESIKGEVPDYQVKQISSVIEDFDQDKAENLALNFLGESTISYTDWKLTGSQARDGEKKVWSAIKNEIIDLICTTSEKYNAIRADFGKKNYIKTAISAISGYILASMGIAATVTAGAISLLLFTALKIGKNAWCQLETSEQ